MSARDAVRPEGERGEAATLRAVRAGARVAQLGLATVETAGRVRQLRGAPAADALRERALVLRDVARRVLHLHGVEVEAAGPLPLGPAILASNHVSWLDPLVVASLVPCAPLSKVDVARWPVVGAIARELGVLFVTRGDARSGARALRSVAEVLQGGVPVLNFPEGTTTDGREVLPFRSGTFGVARRLGVPVVPVAIRYDAPGLAWVGDATFLPHYLGLAARRRTRALVRLGPPAAVEGGAGSSELAAAAHGEVARLLAEIAPP